MKRHYKSRGQPRELKNLTKYEVYVMPKEALVGSAGIQLQFCNPYPSKIIWYNLFHTKKQGHTNPSFGKAKILKKVFSSTRLKHNMQLNRLYTHATYTL